MYIFSCIRKGEIDSGPNGSLWWTITTCIRCVRSTAALKDRLCIRLYPSVVYTDDRWSRTLSFVTQISRHSATSRNVCWFAALMWTRWMADALLLPWICWSQSGTRCIYIYYQVCVYLVCSKPHALSGRLNSLIPNTYIYICLVYISNDDALFLHQERLNGDDLHCRRFPRILCRSACFIQTLVCYPLLGQRAHMREANPWSWRPETATLSPPPRGISASLTSRREMRTSGILPRTLLRGIILNRTRYC